ncbi:MAG: hypothetical protein AB7F99_05980 [Vicinamibacterales bacterium]
MKGSRVALALVACVAHASPARAHAFAERYDLPLPLWYYLAGAGLAVVLSFVAAGLFLRPGARTTLTSGIPLDKYRSWRVVSSRPATALLRALSVVFFAIAIAAGFAGIQGEPLDNLLPVTVWIVWWVGFTYACALIGDVWSAINPVQTLARSLNFLVRGAGKLTPPLDLPARAGVWPAVVLFFAFTWAEIAWPENAVPASLAWAVLLYTAITFTAMAAFGIDVWLERGDPFSRFFALMARLSPIDSGQLRLRPYGAGLVTAVPMSWAELTFVVLALSTVSFDGLRETPFWNELSSATMGVLYRAGLLSLLGIVNATALIKTVGLVLVPLIFLILYLATCRATGALVERSGSGNGAWTTSALARLFVTSLVPIAVGYHLAHYFSYLIIQGQAVIPLLSDPFGRGWDLFGTRSYAPDIGIVGARFVWTVAVGTIVAGHVAAVLVAHATALKAFRDTRTALRSQYPMLALMVVYTMFSLWVLAQPIVED